MKQEKKYGIEAERFFGAVVIICHHFLHFQETPYFWGGWIFVEFFFMLTGYFSIAHFERRGAESFDEKDVLLYIWKKAERFFPYIAVSVTLSFIYRDFVSNDLGIREIFYDIMRLPFYYCGLIKTGIAADVYSMQLWYMAEIFLFLPVILLLAVKKNRLFKYFLAWFLPVMIYAGLLSTLGSITYWDDVFLSNLSCALRGISGMCTGACIYYLCEDRKKGCRWKKILCMGHRTDKLWFLIFVVTACFADVSVMSVTPVLMGALAIAASVCKERQTANSRMRRLCLHLGKLSLPVYCLHYQVMQYIHYFCDFRSWKGALLADLLIIIIVSEICMRTAGRFGRSNDE